MSNSTQPIQQLTDYFGSEYPIPIVHAGWHDAKRRWERSPLRKRVSRSWLRKIRAAGYSKVQLWKNGRLADFNIDELLR